MKQNLLTVSLVAVGSLLVFWAPFVFRINRLWGIEYPREGMSTIVQNFDGVNFLVIEKSWYDREKLEYLSAIVDPGQDPKYYSAHFPVTAAVVWLFDQMTTGPRAVILSIVAGNIFLTYGLYVFFAEWIGKKQAWWLTAMALFLPARMLSVRGVLSTEIWFIPLTLLSLTAARKKQHWQAAGWGALSILTRSPGIILFAAYVTAMWREPKKLAFYLVLPAALIALWLFYGHQFGSIFTYFQSGDNLHLFLPPFRVFGTSETWISGMWREEIIYIYLLFSAGILLWKRKGQGAAWWYPSFFLTTILFVVHRDIARYSLPVAPFVIGGLAKLGEEKLTRYLFLVLIIPVYLYAWQFVVQNIQPVSDWTGLL